MNRWLKYLIACIEDVGMEYPEAHWATVDQFGLSREDCLWAAKQSRFVCDTLYPYMNDKHIDSALRSIIPNLNCSTTNQGA